MADQDTLFNLQIIQANFYRDTIKDVVSSLPDPPMNPSVFEPLRRVIVHLLLRRKLSLAVCAERLGFTQGHRSAIAMQLHKYCREANPERYNRGYVWHLGCGRNITDLPKPPLNYSWHTQTSVNYLQLHAEEFL